MKKSASASKKSVKREKPRGSFYVFLVAYILAIAVLVALFKPFLYSLVLGIILGVFFFPINKFLRSRVSRPNTASLILVILIFLVMLFVSYLFADSVVKEVSNTYKMVANYDFKDVDSFFQDNLGLNFSSESLVMPIVENLRDAVSVSVPSILGSLADIFVGVFIMLFLLFYIFKDGEVLLKNILTVLPVSKNHKDQLLAESRKVLYGVMYGQVLMALLQGVVGGLTFFIFGLNNPVFWGLIMAILAFIPILGTPVVWIPAVILQFYQGNIVSGIGVLAVGVIIIFNIENVIKPKFIGKRTGLHPLLVLLGIFGGLKVLGLIGMLIGPIIVALCVLVIKFFNQEMFLNNVPEKNDSKKNK